jgi:hypothetical protein
MAGIRVESRLTQFSDEDGDPLAGGSLTFFESGTSDLAPIYTDETLAIEQENPLDLDADGRLSADGFYDPAITYRKVLKDAQGNTIAEDDPAGGNDLAAAIEAHDTDPAAHYPASESQRGFVELASQSEVNTGTDTARAVTPAGLANRTATETRAGVIELATSAEVATGTDAVRAVTPAGLASIIGSGGSAYASAAETLTGTSTAKAITPGGFAGNKSLAASGYYKLPGGLILQWGTGSSSQDAAQTFNFPTAFATACYGVIVQRTSNNVTAPLMPSNSPAPTTTQFTIDRDSGISDSVPFTFFAYGV